jgi:hypothetical protein
MLLRVAEARELSEKLRSDGKHLKGKGGRRGKRSR